ncbi:hypothetical protein Tco_1554111 [Tanacetum coccineum]
MHGHSIYHGDRVIGSPRVHDNSKPKALWDIHPESRDPEMFASTYELSYYHMCPGTSVRFHFSVMDGFINPKDDLGVKPNKTNKRKANEDANDEQVIGRTDGFIFKPVTKKRTTFHSTTPSSKKDETGSSLEA